MGETIVFSINGGGSIEYPYGKKKWTLTLHKPYTKINSRCIIEINAKSKTIKIQKKTKEEIFVNLELILNSITSLTTKIFF